MYNKMTYLKNIYWTHAFVEVYKFNKAAYYGILNISLPPAIIKAGIDAVNIELTAWTLTG